MEERNTFKGFIKASFQIGIILLGIEGILFLVTSLTTGQSLFAPEIMKLFVTLFQISMTVVVGLAVMMFLTAVFTVRKNPAVRTSMLVKDGTLKYEYEENGRKKMKTFSLKNIDTYLQKYQKMNLIDDAVLSKTDPDRKPNIRELLITYPDQKAISLAQLLNDDPPEYHRIAAFLDGISDKDVPDLDFHLPRYIHRQQLLNSGNEAIAKLKELRKKTDDREVKESIDNMNDAIGKVAENIAEVSEDDRLRKLYSYYLPMLQQIIADYEVLEKDDGPTQRREEARNKLMQTFELLDQVFKVFTERRKDGDEQEAQMQTLEQLLLQEQTKNGSD